MSDQWYYGSGGQQKGPVSFEQLKQFAGAGEVSGTDLVWTDGMADWIPADQVNDLMPKPVPGGNAEWYYGSGGQQQGPIAFEQLQQLATSGELKPRDQVWKQGMADWVAASKVDGIAFAQPSPDPAPAGPPPMRAARKAAMPAANSGFVFAIPLLAGLAFLFLAFVMPWWSYTFHKPDKDASEKELKEYAEAAKDLNEIQKDNEEWYEAKEIDKKLRKQLRDMEDDDDRASVTLWGWRTGAGLMGLIFSLLLTPLLVVSMFVKVLKPWGWIVHFVVALFGFLMMIMFLLWFFGAPSKNASPAMAQGLIIGPYVSVLGGFLLLAGGALAGIVGLRGFLNSSSSNAG